MLRQVMFGKAAIERKTPGWCAGLLVPLLAGVGIGKPAHAGCFPVREPQFVALRPLVSRDASQALAQAEARIARLPPGSARTDPRRVAALYAIQASAYRELALYHAARASARRGLKLLRGAVDPLREQILSSYAASFNSPAGIARALRRIKQARASLPANSPSALCLKITAGELNILRNRSDLALRELTQSYLRAQALGLPAARIDAGVFLTDVLRRMGEYKQALALIRQTIGWDKAHNSTNYLATDLYFEGGILRAMRHYHRAIAAYRSDRALSTTIDNRQGVAYANLRICQADIALQRFGAARRACNRAAPAFAAGNARAMIKETAVLRARIALGERRPRHALALLNGVLDHSGADLAATIIVPAYLARSRAEAALHRYAAAYRDQSEYLRRFKAENRISQARLKAALEMRFRTSEEFLRNAVLTRKLQAAAHHAAKQRQLLHWMGTAGVAGGLIIVLLSYILISGRRHRRQLLVLANTDPLTGLPNRGHTAQRATRALGSALEHDRPLTVALLDFDHFKTINDQYGHAAGDYVLREFARLSREALRGGDILGRWGGEEFLLVLPETTLDSALLTVGRLCALASRIDIQAGEPPTQLRVTFSAGLATTADGVRTLDEIVARADAALYEAKDAGRDAVRISRAASAVLGSA